MPALFFLLYLFFALALAAMGQTSCINQRPLYKSRNYHSQVIDNLIEEVKEEIADPDLACLFQNTFPNTLDTTVKHVKHRWETKDGKEDAFVITGDINAMWLRDSTNQVLPYLPYLSREKNVTGSLHVLFRGIINRQIKQVNLDPWANAFSMENEDGSCPPSSHGDDYTELKNCGFERKFEIDSLAAFFKLSRSYFQQTKDLKLFDSDWIKAIEKSYSVLKHQQMSTEKSCIQDEKDFPFTYSCGGYTFQRKTRQPTDSLQHSMGNPGKYTGMIRSHFRPSDDATTFPFFIPGNAMLVVELKHLSKIFLRLNSRFSKKLQDLAIEIEDAIQKHGVYYKEVSGKLVKVYAYEVDGYGNSIFMDDANIPSLLSLPFVGYIDSEEKSEIYFHTRQYILNEDTNPYFEKGKYQGIGGPHVGPHYIWPMSLIMQSMTATDKLEVKNCLNTLLHSADGFWFIHESFHKDDVKKFTRSWFAWANGLFGELILHLKEKSPELLSLLR